MTPRDFQDEVLRFAEETGSDIWDTILHFQSQYSWEDAVVAELMTVSLRRMITSELTARRLLKSDNSDRKTT
jgi:hypothetical protein